MKRSTFRKAALFVASVGAFVAIVLLTIWKLTGVWPDEIVIWIYPASLMLMAMEAGGSAFGLFVIVLSVATNAALYFIVASAILGLAAAARGGLTDS